MFSARHALAVTPTDGTPVKFHALYIGGAGDVTVTMVGDTTPTTFKSVPVGTTLWINVIEVKSTGTSATQIVGLN